MKFEKIKMALGVSASVMLLSVINPTLVLADSSEEANYGQDVVDVKSSQESNTVTLHDLLKGENLTTQQENSIAYNLMLELVQSPFMVLARTNSRYFTIHKDISASQVKRIVKSTNKMQNFLNIVGARNDYVDIYSKLFSLYYSKYKIAAKHGWGIRITIRSDNYNPTSTGTSFGVSYIK